MEKVGWPGSMLDNKQIPPIVASQPGGKFASFCPTQHGPPAMKNFAIADGKSEMAGQHAYIYIDIYYSIMLYEEIGQFLCLFVSYFCAQSSLLPF